MVLDADLNRFIELFAQTTGRTLSKKEALPKVLALLQITKLIWHPMTERDLNELRKWRKRTEGGGTD